MFRLSVLLLLSLPTMLMAYRPIYPAGENLQMAGFQQPIMNEVGFQGVGMYPTQAAVAAMADPQSIQLAVDTFEQKVPLMGWSGGAPTAIPLGTGAWGELQAENQKLMNKDLALLLSHAKTNVQAPVRTRTQPIIRPVPPFQQPIQAPTLNAPMRVEAMKQHQNQLLTQQPIVSSSPLMTSKSPLAQAVLSRGLFSHSAALSNAQAVMADSFQQQEHPLTGFGMNINPMRFGYGGMNGEFNMNENIMQQQNLGNFGYTNTPYTQNPYNVAGY